MHHRRRFMLCAVFLAAGWLATLHAGRLSAAPTTAHDADLPAATPEQQGIDSARLVELCRFLESSEFDIRSLLIARNGRIVFERYEQELTPEHNFYVYSVTKSFNSTLIGIALDRKLIGSIDEPVVADFFKEVQIREPDGRRNRITLKDLLTMSSGIEWQETTKTGLDPDSDLARMVNAPNRVRFMLNRPMAADPGTKFNYSNGDAQLLAAIVARKSGVSVPEFARQNLFDKMGFRNWEWVWPDRTGLHPGGYGLRLRARDMIKLGQLFLQDGKWNNEQLVSASWVHAATRDQTTGKDGYGFQWWTNINAAGHQSYSAIGLKGQYVRVIPDLRLVISMTSVLDIAAKNQTFNRIVNQYIVPATKGGPLPANASAARQLDAALHRANQIKRKLADPSEENTPRIPDAGRHLTD